jgi:translation initiation factor 1 (eIF-1/SUI1)
METNFLENVILVSVRRHKNNQTTVLQNIPRERIEVMLRSCKKCFGCGGRIGTELSKDIIILQGDQTMKLREHKDTIFEGLEIRSGESK